MCWVGRGKEKQFHVTSILSSLSFPPHNFQILTPVEEATFKKTKNKQKNKANFNHQEHIYICCYSKQNNANHLYNSTDSLGKEFTVFHFSLPDARAQVKRASEDVIVTEGGTLSGELRLSSSSSHSITPE